MMEEIGGKVRNVNLNNHVVSVITPKKPVSYEKGNKNVEKMIQEIKGG